MNIPWRLSFTLQSNSGNVPLKARMKPGMGRDSMVGDVEREEGGRNGKSDEENGQAGISSRLGKCRLYFLMS